MSRQTSIATAAWVAAVLVGVSVTAAAEGQMARYVRFRAGDVTAYGVVEGERVRQLEGSPFAAVKPTDKTYPLAEVKLLVPTQPKKILAAAGNYKSHLQDQPEHEHPELFLKPVSCLIPDGTRVVLPKGSERIDAEAELVIVIGKRAKKVPVDKAMDYVFGVTCGADISARDWQDNDVQWWRAKGTDTFGPCGPCIVSGIDYDKLMLRGRVNGEVTQEQSTADMVHGVAAMVSYASQYVTLEPGDLIYTGTPGQTPQLKPGDMIEVEIEHVGVLKNPVVGAK